MIGQDELLKYVAERCGISKEISNYFFEVFINRLSSKLKIGEVIQIDNIGYFQKRRCRIPAEKSDSKTPETAHIFQTILFSDDPEIQNDLKTFMYFNIPDLKNLWENDKDLELSLQAGDFSPYTTRTQLINSYATKAEVIISGFRKLDKVFEEDFLFPFGFKPKLKETSDSISNYGFDNTNSGLTKVVGMPENKQTVRADSVVNEKPKSKESTESTLPWNIGKKFYDKKVDQPTPEDFKSVGNKTIQSKTDSVSKQPGKVLTESDKKIDAEEALDAAIEESDIDKDLSRFREFQPVRSRLSSVEVDRQNPEEQSRLRSSKSKTPAEKVTSTKTTQKFTEVKSKSEVYHLRADIKKIQKKNKLPDDKSINIIDPFEKYKGYRENRNYIPFIIILAVIIIAGAAIYFYFIRTDEVDSKPRQIVQTVNPPPGVNIIDRDYEFSITYPYPKTENKIPVEGINPNVFATEQVKLSKEEPVKTPPIISEPVVEKKEEVKVEEKPKVEPKVEKEVPEQKSSRIFLYNNYYVVFVGSYSTYAAADRAAENFFDEGFNAIIEVEEVPGKPTRYNLNVGDFTSEQFARDFELKYIKK